MKTEEEFSLNLAPFSSRFMVLACCHPLIIVLIVTILFLPSGAFHEFFSISFLWRPSCHNSSFSACSYRSPNLTGASFKYPLISSWSHRSHVSKSPQVSSFVSNSSRWIVPLLLSFSILMVVRSRFHFLRYHINSFVVSKSHRWFHQYLLKFTLYPS